MKQEILSCDICGKQREGLSERWYKVRLTTMLEDANLVALECVQYTDTGRGKDVCGDICALRMIGRWLEHGTLEEGEPRPAKARSA